MSNTPQIRFAGFTDAWEQRKLGDVFVEYSEKGHDELPPLTIIQGKGTILREESERNLIYDKSGLKNYKLVNQDDFILHLRSFEGGLEKANSRGIVSPAYHIFHGENADTRFYYPFFRSKNFISVLLKPHVYGIRDGKSIDVDGMKTIDIPYPKIEEQNKIGDYFAHLNSLITLHQRKCDALQKFKKSMLQKMFPQNGESVPEIRFAGFTDAWEQREFGDLAEYKKGPFGSAITKDMFVPKSDLSVKVYEQQNAINKDWTLERYFLPKEYVITKLKSFEVHGGDIIVSCAGTIGEIYEIPINAECGIINQALMRVRVNEDVVGKKLFTIVFSNMIEAFSSIHSNGSAIKNIPPFADLKPMEVLIPSIEEQKKIENYFCNLDSLITLHQRKLETLQKMKKSLLQKMFV